METLGDTLPLIHPRHAPQGEGFAFLKSTARHKALESGLPLGETLAPVGLSRMAG